MADAPTIPAPRVLRFGSFCSGIGAPEAAWVPLGWTPQFFAEIEPFPCAVLAHHYPEVPNFGDMTAIDPAQLPDADCWVAGTPCQAFSVAGLRGSLSDERGNLTLHFVKLIHARNPRIVVWENVPGVLSTQDNAFGCFLAGLVGEAEPLVCGEGSWPDAGMVAGPVRSAAWRILDAQYFGLAQRRRRVFVVSFRTGDRLNPGAVLFEPESLRRDTPPSREAGARVAGCFAARTGGGGGFGKDFESDGGLVPAYQCHGSNVGPMGHLRAGNGNEAGGVPFLPVPIDMRQASRGATMTNNRGEGACSGGAPGTGIGEPGDPAPSVSLSHPPAVAAYFTPRVIRNSHTSNQVGIKDGDVVDCLSTDGPGAIAFDTTQITSDKNFSSPKPGDPCHPLSESAHPPAVAFNWQAGGTQSRLGYDPDAGVTGSLHVGQTPAVAFQERGRENGRSLETQDDLAYSLNAPNGGGRRQENNVATGMAVRRLTPRECERLQGFSDNYTAIPFKGKPAADGPRYRALGNSMAVPVVRWIGERIAKVLAATEVP